MRIVGFNFKKITCERKKDNFKGQIKINTNLDVSNIEKDSLDFLKGQDLLNLSFNYTIKYDPEFAEVAISGNVLVLLDSKDEKINQIIKDWKKNKLPDNLRIPLFNHIMTKCNIKAVTLEEAFNLPFHFPLPKLASNQTQTNYAG